MRIILSRKGFDSGYGGYPSPILPNGRLLSLPIPDSTDNIAYSSLVLENGKTYYDLMNELKPGYLKENSIKINFNINSTCHLDPDLDYSVTQRKQGWKPAFGQVNQSQTHLENQSVGVGDIFLFFGWFRKTKEVNGKLVFDPTDIEGSHVIFAYLQVGEIVKANLTSRIPGWLEEHPHAKNNHRRTKKNNSIYIASSTVSWNNNLNGANYFKFDDSLVLTKKGLSRSKWNLPSFFQNASISYHKKESWKDGYFKSVDKGQEFVIQDNSYIEKWVMDLIEKNS
jgi:hypothetical protein